MRRRAGLYSLLLAAMLVILGTNVSAAPSADRVHFTAAGDFASTANTDGVLDALHGLDSDFTLALGDLSYGTTGQEAAWCDYVNSHLGAGYPFELVPATTRATGSTGTSTTSRPACPTSCPA